MKPDAAQEMMNGPLDHLKGVLWRQCSLWFRSKAMCFFKQGSRHGLWELRIKDRTLKAVLGFLSLLKHTVYFIFMKIFFKFFKIVIVHQECAFYLSG